jgi:hypothetical protein
VNWNVPASSTTTPAAIGTARASQVCCISICASAMPRAKASAPIRIYTEK